MEPNLPYLGILGSNFHIWSQRPQICLIANFRAEIKILKFGTKNVLFGCLCAGILRTCCHTSNQCPQIGFIAKFLAKQKILKFGTKKTLFGWFEKHLYQTIVMFEVIILEFVSSQSLVQKKSLNSQTKRPYLGVFNLKL